MKKASSSFYDSTHHHQMMTRLEAYWENIENACQTLVKPPLKIVQNVCVIHLNFHPFSHTQCSVETNFLKGILNKFNPLAQCDALIRRKNTPIDVGQFIQANIKVSKFWLIDEVGRPFGHLLEKFKIFQTNLYQYYALFFFECNFLGQP